MCTLSKHRSMARVLMPILLAFIVLFQCHWSLAQSQAATQATVVTTNILEQMDGEWRFVLHHSSNFSDESEEDEDEDEDMDFETNGPGSMGDPN